MNQSYKIKAMRRKQQYSSNTATIQIEDEDQFEQCVVQDGKIFQEVNRTHMIVIDDDVDMKEPIKGQQNPNFQAHIDSDDEDKQKKANAKNQSISKHNKENPKPLDKDYFQSISQRVTTHLDNEIQQQEPEPVEVIPETTLVNNQEAFSRTQYQFLKLKEAQEQQMLRLQAVQQQKLEQELQMQEEEKKQQEGETNQQYIERMFRLLQKELNQNKRYKNGEDAVKKKQEQIDQQENKDEKEKNLVLDEDKFIQDLLKTYQGDSLALSKEVQQINLNDPYFLNYDVLVKTNKILKQARIHYQSDSENEQQIQKKKAKDPYSIFRVWEHYGVSAEEYFASKDPYFAMRKSLLSRNSSDLPKPKSEPKYFSFDIDRLISKRYSDLHQEVQYQAQFIGYPKKQWTPIKHLICKCPQLLINYEIHERDRLYCTVLNLKVHSVKQSTSFCMLSHKIIQGKKESPQVIYLKSLKDTQTEFKKSQKLKQKKKMVKIQEDEVEEDTARALRNKLRKEKMEQIQLEELERVKEEQERKKQTKQNNHKTKLNSKSKQNKTRVSKVRNKSRKFKYSISNTSSNESENLLSQEINQFEIQHKKLKKLGSDSSQLQSEIKDEGQSSNEINQNNRMYELD